MALIEPNEGGAISKFWEDPIITKQLEGVKTWLTKNAKKVKKEDLNVLGSNLKILFLFHSMCHLIHQLLHH